MSSYSPIADRPESALKTEHSQRASLHPYSSSYTGASSPNSTQHAIHISPVAPTHMEPTAGPSTFNSQDGGQRISRYETSLALRYDVEAALAYVLGIFSGALLLVLEKKNDYVRFHAWQSAFLSVVSFIALVFMALVSDTLYWMLLLASVGLHLYMARRAYFDGAVFERFTLPYIGPLAVQFIDEE